MTAIRVPDTSEPSKTVPKPPLPSRLLKWRVAVDSAAAEKRLDAWVAVSKLHAKSLGDDKLAPKHWNAVFTLEGERARRLAVLERAARP